MTVAFRSLRNPNPLGFPGGVRPGVDPTHVLSRGCWFSGVAYGSNFLNLLSGGLGSNTGSPASVLDSAGPATQYTSTTKSSFSGPAASATGTIACIVKKTVAFNGTNEWICDFGGSTVGYGLAALNGTPLLFDNVSISSGLTMSVGVPYLYIGSWIDTSSTTVTVNFVLVDLTTGRITSATVSSSTSAHGPSTLFIGNRNDGIRPWAGNLYALCASTAFFSVSGLLQIAVDPWSFWYPRRDATFVGTSNLRIISTDFDLPSGLFAPNLSPGYRNKPSLAFPSSGIFSSLAISQGTYTLTGKSQTPNSSRSISAAEGTYTQTGEAQNLLRSRPMVASQGTYTLTGESQNFNRGIKVSAAQGTYTQTGELQTLGVGIPAVQGSYTLTGKPQSFAVALSIKPVTGVYTLTGLPQVLTNTKFGTSGQALGTKFIADTGNMTSRDY